MKPTPIDLRSLAASIAARMPGYYLADRDPEYDTSWDKREYLIASPNRQSSQRQYIRGNTKGFNLKISEGRLRVSCLWPADSKFGSDYSPRESETITLSPAKTPATLAKDILRRLGAWYDQQWAEQCIHRVEREISIDTKRTFGDLCKEIMGRAVYERGNNGGGDNAIMLHCGGIEIEIHSDSNATLKSSYCSHRLIEKILRAMASTGMFEPVCENTECLKPATKFTESHRSGGKSWWCDACYVEHLAAEAEDELWRAERRRQHEEKLAAEAETEELQPQPEEIPCDTATATTA